MKKILSSFILTAILVQLFHINIFSYELKITGENEADFLDSLGIISTWEITEPVTRAEFVNAAMRCVIRDSGAKNMTSSVKADKSVFTDVPMDYWAAYNIEAAKARGIVSGTVGGEFNPEGYLSRAAAIKIVVSALGYAPFAEENGGFPIGYLSVAERLKISKTEIQNDDILTKGEAAVLLKNMLETAPVKSIYGANGSEMKMPSESDDSLLNMVYSIKSFEGVVTANEYSSVDSVKTVGNGKVCIKSTSTENSAIFFVNGTKASDYLGRRLAVYYYDNEPYELAYVLPYDGDTLVIDGNDLLNASFTSKKIEYTQKNTIDDFKEKVSKKSVKISTYTDVIHNGIFTNDIENVFDIINGETEESVDSVKLYDNDDDGKYDVIDVISYYTIHADYVYDGEDRLVITDNVTEKSIIVDKEKGNAVERRYTASGVETASYGITKGNTVGVAYAKGEAELYNLYISKDSRSDVIKVINNEMLQSEKNTYLLSDTFKKYFEKNNIPASFKINEQYTLYIDHKGKLAGYYSKETSFDSYYGMIKDKDDYLYILNAYKATSSKNDYSLEFKTVNLEAEVSTRFSADTLKIDGRKVKSGDLSVDDAISVLKGKFVKYTSDASGKIKTITLPEKNVKDNVFSYSPGFEQGNGAVNLRYRAGPKVFYKDGVGSTAITSDTTILWVPYSELVDEGVDVNLYCKRGTTSDFRSDQYYYVNAYKLNASSVTADILIAYNNNEYRVDSFSKPIIVRKVVLAQNKYGNISTLVYGIQENKEVEIASEEAVFKNRYGVDVTVEPGDLIRCQLNAREDCRVIDMLLDCSDYSDVTTSFSSAYRAIKGSVYQHDANAMYIVKNKWEITDEDILPSNMETQICTSSANIYLFDTEAKTLKKVNSGSLVDYKSDKENYSRVAVANSYGTPDLIVIYE